MKILKIKKFSEKFRREKRKFAYFFAKFSEKLNGGKNLVKI